MKLRTVLKVPAQLADVDAASSRLRIEAAGVLDGDTLDRFEIATSEALTNIVRHAYADTNDGEIAIELIEDEGPSLLLVLRDRGSPAPPGTFDRPPERTADEDAIDVIPETGWGIGLLHQCADAVHFASIDGRNELRLQFRA